MDSGTVGGVFTGQPPYTVGNGGDGHHNAGQACLGCHGGGGGPTQFTWAGTLYDAAGSPVVGAEVRVVDSTGNGISVYTGTNGNFYSPGGALSGPASTGARNASSVALMISTFSSGDCNSCHATGGTVAPIHLP